MSERKPWHTGDALHGEIVHVDTRERVQAMPEPDKAAEMRDAIRRAEETGEPQLVTHGDVRGWIVPQTALPCECDLTCSAHAESNAEVARLREELAIAQGDAENVRAVSAVVRAEDEAELARLREENERLVSLLGDDGALSIDTAPYPITEREVFFEERRQETQTRLDAAERVIEAARVRHHGSCQHTGDNTACLRCELKTRLAAYDRVRGER
jgi:hypothetical protein